MPPASCTRLRVGEPQREPRAARGRARCARASRPRPGSVSARSSCVTIADQRRGGARRADGAEGRHRSAAASPKQARAPAAGLGARPSRRARRTASSRRGRRSRRRRRCGRGWWTAWVQCSGAARPRPCGQPRVSAVDHASSAVGSTGGPGGGCTGRGGGESAGSEVRAGRCGGRRRPPCAVAGRFTPRRVARPALRSRRDA